jgi:hypothetical protein
VREDSPTYERTNQEMAKGRGKALVETAWQSGIVDAKVKKRKDGVKSSAYTARGFRVEDATENSNVQHAVVRLQGAWKVCGISASPRVHHSHSHKQADRNKHGELHKIGRCTSDEPDTQAPTDTVFGKLCDAAERARVR